MKGCEELLGNLAHLPVALHITQGNESNENIYLISISSGGNLHMDNMTPLPVVLSVFNFLQLRSP
jgi:hypothetical protein